jgi:hypothetical protein
MRGLTTRKEASGDPSTQAGGSLCLGIAWLECPAGWRVWCRSPLSFAGDDWFWVMGRVDDVSNMSGYRLGTMAIESAW